MFFSRFCKFALNISICDINKFVYLLKEFCVFICYLQGSFFRCLKCSSNSKDFSFACTGPSFNFIKAWNSNIFQEFYAFSKGISTSLGLKRNLKLMHCQHKSLWVLPFLLHPQNALQPLLLTARTWGVLGKQKKNNFVIWSDTIFNFLLCIFQFRYTIIPTTSYL